MGSRTRPEAFSARRQVEAKRGFMAFKKIKEKFSSWMKSLAAANEKEYGKKELSCCGMNKQK